MVFLKKRDAIFVAPFSIRMEFVFFFIFLTMSVSKAIDDISSFDAKQVLIFGGSRFMGHSLTKTLLEKGHFVTIVNRGNLYWVNK